MLMYFSQLPTIFSIPVKLKLSKFLCVIVLIGVWLLFGSFRFPQFDGHSLHPEIYLARLQLVTSSTKQENI